MLNKAGHTTRVVSVPCFELFEAQSDEYKAATIGDSKVKIAIEAAIEMGWRRFIGDDGAFVGMTGFGASGPYKELYEHFGITADAVTELAIAKLSK
jgi:transketolase